eukprot:7378942-Prymnesium_polylepis.1
MPWRQSHPGSSCAVTAPAGAGAGAGRAACERAWSGCPGEPAVWRLAPRRCTPGDLVCLPPSGEERPG